MKIDIKIDDNRKFAAVAFLVDRDDFLADIQEVRKIIKFTKLPYTFPVYPYPEANKIVALYNSKRNIVNINDARSILEDICKEKGLLNLSALDPFLGKAVIFAESLTRKYRKDSSFIPVVLTAILGESITEVNLLPTQMFEINRKVVEEELEWLDKDEEIMTIRVNRDSTAKEVQGVFDFIQKYYFKTKPTDPTDGLNTVYDKTYYENPTDTAGNIKRDREWYWLKKEGSSYQEIRKTYIEIAKKRISLRGIELAIKRYSDNLQ